MAAPVEYFGVRHHGPGSARRLVEALDALRPVEVLVEGPSDLSEILPMLASPAMVPPVALLAYPADAPETAMFWPFAVFSPEYQAVKWAVREGVPVRFIDLPVAWRVPAPLVLDDADPEDTSDDEAAESAPEEGTGDADFGTGTSEVMRDPIGALARAAGYEDGESWWSHVIEENPDPGPIFAAVADAMGALREGTPPPEGFEAAREAHMRLEIAKSAKAADGPVAVVCGAWHVPALTAKHTAKDDRALLKGAPKRKVSATWTPWTAPRLATFTGYGAGVPAPGWSRHVWETDRAELTTRWVTKMARALRAEGQVVSTASLIETERLAVSLAALRGRPQPGFEEMKEAAVACMCYGNAALWRTIATDLLVGHEVGVIPDDVPLAPLLEDLQRQQKKARLKPEALDKELGLDLRSESGLFRSTLLHRLNALGVPWGRLDDPGRSRGTFRERWILRWEPEYAVELVENLVYGPTISQAASGRTMARMKEAASLKALSDLVFAALTAQLPEAARAGTAMLEARASQTSDAGEMLAALPPLADVLRYGKARETDTGQMEALFERIAVQGALALPYAVRGLDAEAAKAMRDAMSGADRAIRLLDLAAVGENWRGALEDVANDAGATRLLSGQAARLLYEADEMTSEDAVLLLGRMLSPGTTTADAAGFFEGFLEGAGARLIHDTPLRDCVNDWLLALEGETFTESLPLFRRVFSSMDQMERKRLLDALLGKQAVETGFAVIEDADTIWPAHLDRLSAILKGDHPVSDMDETPEALDDAGMSEAERRWRLALGGETDGMSQSDQRLSSALSALYEQPQGRGGKGRKGGLGRSAPAVAKWMGDVREFFPTPVVQVVQKDAFERLGLQQMLMEPEFLAVMEADVNLVADLMTLRGVMPEKTKQTAREVIAKVVAELMERLERKTAEALRGAVDRSKRTTRPRFVDIDWPRTIRANLHTYLPEHETIVPERLIGFQRKQRRIVDLDEVMLCVDQSGSMAQSVIYASIFAAVMASLPVVKTKLVCFDTVVLDLTEELEDPVEVLFGVQLGGGTDINQAVAYCADKIERPAKSHMILITDLYEGGNAKELVARLARLVTSGVNVIVLLALADDGRPFYSADLAATVAALGIPVFACTPDQFPDMMAAALRREDIHQWAAGEDIKVITEGGDETG